MLYIYDYLALYIDNNVKKSCYSLIYKYVH